MKKNVLLLAIAALTVSCSNEEIMEPMAQLPIGFSAASEQKVLKNSDSKRTYDAVAESKKNRKPRSHGGFLFWVFVAFGSQTDGKRRLTSVAMPSEAFWLMTSMW